MRYTEGEWVFDGHSGRVSAGETTVAYISGIPAEHLANGRLIARAKEMLKLLDAARHALRSYECCNSATDLARELSDSIDQLFEEVSTSEMSNQANG